MPVASPRRPSIQRSALAFALCITGALTLAACGTSRVAETLPPPGSVAAMPGYQYLTSDYAKAEAQRRLATLADDAMAGREAGTEGERLASTFIADELERLGAAPGGELIDGERSYFQTFTLDTYAFDHDRTRFAFEDGPAAATGDDWIAFPSNSADVDLQGVPFVFAGYGLSAPEQGIDSYAELDVRGKVVLVAAGSPAGVDSVRGPQGYLEAGSFLPKYIAAAQRGAVAILPVADGFLLDSWSAYRNMALGTQMEPLGAPVQISPLPLLFVHPRFAEQLLTELGGPADAMARAARGESLTAFEPSQPVTLTIAKETGTADVRNVVGVVRGDEQPDEFVAYGAHYDHLGTIAGEIFNGADDDASGVTTILAVAEALAADRAADNTIDRSALFVFHTAEEKGLHGSEYFVANPDRSILGDIDRVVSQVNLDMVAREHPDSLYVVGASRLSTTYGQTVETVNRMLGTDSEGLFAFNYAYDDPDHPENIYERSDHYSYAKRGVPVVFFTDGMGANWAKGSESDDYHRPDDDVEFIDFDKLMRVARLAYAVGRTTADTDARPAVDQPVKSEP